MKKLLLTASGIFLVASMYIGINSHKNLNAATDLLLANVEALTWVEGGCTSCGDCSYEVWICHSQIAQFWHEFYIHCSGGNPTVNEIPGC
ncbi:MAG: hypothetical protein PHS48_02405 [Bacteroidales bacterium]|nr:hypothetical protein [Bacteroidales bacterium]